VTSFRRCTVVCAVLLAALFAAPRAAHADDAAARQHFRHGVDLYDKKQYEPALVEFRAAYAEKSSPGIKQNIALCLKGLGRPIEAARAFDEALDEGEGTLKPEVRGAIAKELAELSKIVATVQLKTVSAADKTPFDTAKVTITVDGTALAPGALRRPVRLEPGIHVFTAHADGLADPPEKKLSILAGSPVDATFELGAASGLLTIRPNVDGATVQVDGLEVGHGVWSGKLTAGTHRVSVSAPTWNTTTADVVVSSGASVEYPITLLHPGDVPPEYNPPKQKPPQPVKTRYIVPAIAYGGEAFRLGTVLGEPPGGTKRSFAGGSLSVRGGYRVSRLFALEAYGEVGQLSESYTIGSAVTNSDTKLTHWQLTPVLRFSTTGPVRLTIGSGFGVHGFVADADIHISALSTGTNASHKGSGVSASWLADVGIQFDVGPIFLEAVVLGDVHGVGTVRDDATNERMLLSSPGTRIAVRAGLGISF